MTFDNNILDNSQHAQLSTTDQLFNIWTSRYLSIDLPATTSAYVLEETASSEGRQRTVERLPDELIEDVCKRAALRTKDLYTHHQNLNLNKTAELASFAIQVYPILLEFYRTYTPVAVSQTNGKTLPKSSLSVFAIPEIRILAELIRPLLMVFQSQDLRSTDWQTRSFLTTEFNLSGKLLLEFLSPAEQILLSPYFSFLEEYVAIPWQRVCTAAASHSLMSPRYRVVERMLPHMSDISMAVYTQGCKSFGGYYNRRGQLDKPDVKHSSLRDMHMFQAYLWLCVLQGDLEAIEQELFVFCDLVYKGIGVPWEMAIQGTKLLANEILQRLDPSEQTTVSTYINGMMRIFATA